jgi:ABC-type antimicrobial peptide transport system permease subunit
MFKNYFKIAWRTLRTDKMFSGLNVLGLSIGLTISILLFAFVSVERSFDTGFKNKDAIYRVLVNTQGEMFNNQIWCTAPAALAPALTNEAPDVKYATRIYHHNFGKTAFVNIDDTNFSENRFFWCDPELFTIFGIEVLKGDSKNTLVRPNTVALSESTAKKYFGDSNPIGRTIKVDNRDQLEVTAVYKDFPFNSSLDINVMGSFSTTHFAKNPQWGNSSFETYVMLGKNASVNSAELQMQQVLDKNVDKKGQWFAFSLQPLNKVHLYSGGYFNTYTSQIGDIHEIRNLSAVAILILLIACVNYMNLMTARSAKKAKDVGVNKTLGASIPNLIGRFYTETALITCIALVIGIIMAILLMPVFNSITQSELKFENLFHIEFVIGIILFWGITTLIAGSYPAFYLTRFAPTIILSQKSSGSANAFIRKSLVVLQFAASVILIVGVLVVYQQIRYMMDKNLGFNPENVVAISTGGINDQNGKESLIQEFKALTQVSAVSMAQGYPGLGVSGRSIYKDANDEEGMNIQTNVADAHITDALQLKILAGQRLPLVKQAGDSLVEVLLNKEAVDYLGYTPEQALGKKVTMSLGNNAYVVGVVENFNFESLHQPIGAYAFHNSPSEPKSFLLVRLNSQVLASTMGELEAIFKKVAPNSAFEYTFLDNTMKTLYARERKTATVGFIFCLLAIFVASLGLFGLAAFTAEQRKKEIGVRKVLGASILGIAQMLAQDFLKLVAISLIIAFPIAYYFVHRWLETFAYRIDLGWSAFAAAGFAALAVTLFTVSFQAIKAAITNPIKSLRTE